MHRQIARFMFDEKMWNVIVYDILRIWNVIVYDILRRIVLHLSYVFWTYITVGTRVNEVCTQILETCIDDNAECNSSNICDCKEGFEWNGVKCCEYRKLGIIKGQ